MRVYSAPGNAVLASIFKSSVPAGNRSLVGLAALVFTVAAAASGPAPAGDDLGGGHDQFWVGTWGASPQLATGDLFGTAPSFSNQTIRQIVRISVGGRHFRVRLTNEYGTQALQIGAAHVAISAGAAAIQPGTDRVLTFSGSPSITIPPSPFRTAKAIG